MNWKALTIFFLLIFVGEVIFLVINFGEMNSRFFNAIEINETNINCEDLNLGDTTRCLVDGVKEWFVYNDTNDYRVMSEKDLQQRGGDCKYWSAYYKKKFEQLGYDSQIVTYYVDDVGHVFNIVYDETGYCIVDQTISVCTGDSIRW